MLTPEGALWREALAAVRTLRDAGHQAYLVGGCVRDLLLGREPADYDIVSGATPAEVERLFPRTVPVGRAFGVMLVVTPAGSLEVATFREEEGYADGRRPDRVVFSDLEHDVMRRDFTINGLALDPLTGRTIDLVGGREDIERRLIRTIGAPAHRFGEDHLRMVRAIRFAAALRFEIDPGALAAIRRLAPEIGRISVERIGRELERTVTAPGRARGLELLAASGLLAEVLPEVEAQRGVPQPPAYHPEGDVFTHTVLTLGHLPDDPPAALAFAALLHDAGKPDTLEYGPDRLRFPAHARTGAEMAGRTMRRLRFPAAETALVEELVGQHMRFIDAPRMTVATLRRFLALPRFDLHLALHRADCLASHGDLSTYRFCEQRLAELAGAPAAPPRLVGGDDLIAAGFRPGPAFGRVLEAAYDRQLEGRFAGRPEAVAWTVARMRREEQNGN